MSILRLILATSKNVIHKRWFQKIRMQYNTTHALVIQKGIITVERFSVGGDKIPGKATKSLSTRKLNSFKKQTADTKSVINLDT